MEYLATHGLIHRDLATRNVLLDSQHKCKIGSSGACSFLNANANSTADFGMSRDLDNGDNMYYRSTSNGMIPVR